MGFFKKVVNKIYKFTFGIDLNKQQKYIDTLETQIKKLKKTNIKLKKVIKTQEQLLHICNENLQRILEPMNRLITFKLYFGVEGTGKSTTTSNFEFTLRGITPAHYTAEMIAEQYNNERVIRMLIELFKISWLDHNSISNINKSGYDDVMIAKEPTEYLDVSLSIDNSNIMYPSQKIDNLFYKN